MESCYYTDLIQNLQEDFSLPLRVPSKEQFLDNCYDGIKLNLHIILDVIFDCYALEKDVLS